MIRIIVVILVYLVSVMGIAQTNTDQTDKRLNIVIKVNNASSDKGKIYFALYNSEESFNQKKAVFLNQSKIKDGMAEVTFSNLEPNYYAVVCFHDANDNGKMDFQTNGMPLEDYGTTNNVMSFGPPQFSDAKFKLTDQDLAFEIKF